MQESHEYLADLWNTGVVMLPAGIDIGPIDLAGGFSVITFVATEPPRFLSPPILEPYFLGGCL